MFIEADLGLLGMGIGLRDRKYVQDRCDGRFGSAESGSGLASDGKATRESSTAGAWVALIPFFRLDYPGC